MGSQKRHNFLQRYVATKHVCVSAEVYGNKIVREQSEICILPCVCNDKFLNSARKLVAWVQAILVVSQQFWCNLKLDICFFATAPNRVSHFFTA